MKCDDIGDPFNEMGISKPKTGETPPTDDYHVTLMYSKDTKEDPNRILDTIQNSRLDIPYECKVKGAECFEDDASKSCIVLLLDDPILHKIHDFIRSLGLRHSYPEFIPHITLRYNMDLEEAHNYKDLINTSIEVGTFNKTVYLHNVCSEIINTDYV